MNRKEKEDTQAAYDQGLNVGHMVRNAGIHNAMHLRTLPSAEVLVYCAAAILTLRHEHDPVSFSGPEEQWLDEFRRWCAQLEQEKLT